MKNLPLLNDLSERLVIAASAPFPSKSPPAAIPFAQSQIYLSD